MNIDERLVDRYEIVDRFIRHSKERFKINYQHREYDDLSIQDLTASWKEVFPGEPVPLIKGDIEIDNEVFSKGGPTSRIEEGLATLKESRKKLPLSAKKMVDPRQI